MLRVVNKDMTYATQLKDYEDAVISKRFEELQEDEVREEEKRKTRPSVALGCPLHSRASSLSRLPRAPLRGGESARAPRERAVS